MYSISFQEDSLLPRERLAKEGVEALSNQELLAIYSGQEHVRLAFLKLPRKF